MEVVRQLTVWMVKLLSRIALRVKVTGRERIPLSGPAIVAINHVNSIEGPLLYVTWPREIIGLGKVELWSNPILKVIANSLKAIPVRRGELDLNAVRQSVKVLQDGKVLGLAPEGTRSNHGRLQPGRPGAVLLALRAPETPIVPVAIYGQEKYRESLRRLRRTEVNLVVGEHFWLDPGDERVTHEMRQQMTDEIMMQIAALLPSENRGVYSDLASATERYLRFRPGTESNLQRALRSSQLPSAAAAGDSAPPSRTNEVHPQRREQGQ
jgi:1-acyl-sn-glycerol-3-phosphate acyltransferase